MSQSKEDKNEFLKGTMDMLILKVVAQLNQELRPFFALLPTCRRLGSYEIVLSTAH